MKIKVKCPCCGKKICFKALYENRKKSKREKKELQIIANLHESCEEFHSL